MDLSWPATTPGVLVLPSGRRVRGRSSRTPPPPGPPATWSVHLAARRPGDLGTSAVWIRWRDFWRPATPDEAIEVLRRALDRTGTDRVEVVCRGGVGRTGSALAALCVLDGCDPQRAVARVRRHYHPRAVEAPWQRRFVRRAATADARAS